MDKMSKNKKEITTEKKILIIIVTIILVIACILGYFIRDIKTYKSRNAENIKGRGSAYSTVTRENGETIDNNRGNYGEENKNASKIKKGEGLEKHNIDRNNTDFKKVPNCNVKSDGSIVTLAEDFLRDPLEAKNKYKGETVRIESSSYTISGNRNFILLTPNTGNPKIDKVQFTCYVSPKDKEMVDNMEKAEPVYVEGRVGYVGKLTGFDIDATDFGYVD